MTVFVNGQFLNYKFSGGLEFGWVPGAEDFAGGIGMIEGLGIFGIHFCRGLSRSGIYLCRVRE
jgi:hypothetical protein